MWFWVLILSGQFKITVCPANGFWLLLARPASVTEPADVDVREATSQAQKLAETAKLVDDFLIFQPPGCTLGRFCLPLQKIARDCRVDRLLSVLWEKLSDRTAGFPSGTSASGHESLAGVVHPLEKCGYFQYGICYARKSSRGGLPRVPRPGLFDANSGYLKCMGAALFLRVLQNDACIHALPFNSLLVGKGKPWPLCASLKSSACRRRHRKRAFRQSRRSPYSTTFS